MLTQQKQKPGSELRCSGRVCNPCSTSGTHRGIIVTNMGRKN